MKRNNILVYRCDERLIVIRDEIGGEVTLYTREIRPTIKAMYKLIRKKNK